MLPVKAVGSRPDAGRPLKSDNTVPARKMVTEFAVVLNTAELDRLNLYWVRPSVTTQKLFLGPLKNSHDDARTTLALPLKEEKEPDSELMVLFAQVRTLVEVLALAESVLAVPENVIEPEIGTAWADWLSTTATR